MVSISLQNVEPLPALDVLLRPLVKPVSVCPPPLEGAAPLELMLSVFCTRRIL
jgi:hypothetical protein